MYTKSPMEVMSAIAEGIYPLRERPLHFVDTSPPKIKIKPSARLILEEAINSTNDWIAKGRRPETPYAGRHEKCFSGIFLNKLKQAFKDNNGATLFPKLDLKTLSTDYIDTKFDFRENTYKIEILFHKIKHWSYNDEARGFLESMAYHLKKIGDPNKCRGHLLKTFSPFYQKMEQISQS